MEEEEKKIEGTEKKESEAPVEPQVVESGAKQAEAKQAPAKPVPKTEARDRYFADLDALNRHLEAQKAKVKPLDDDALEKVRRRQRASKIVGGISDVARSIANMMATTQYAPDGYDNKRGMLAKTQKRLDKEAAEYKARQDEYDNYRRRQLEISKAMADDEAARNAADLASYYKDVETQFKLDKDERDREDKERRHQDTMDIQNKRLAVAERNASANETRAARTGSGRGGGGGGGGSRRRRSYGGSSGSGSSGRRAKTGSYFGVKVRESTIKNNNAMEWVGQQVLAELEEADYSMPTIEKELHRLLNSRGGKGKIWAYLSSIAKNYNTDSPAPARIRVLLRQYLAQADEMGFN